MDFVNSHLQHNCSKAESTQKQNKFSVLRQICNNSATFTKHFCNLFVFSTTLPSPFAPGGKDQRISDLLKCLLPVY